MAEDERGSYVNISDRKYQEFEPYMGIDSKDPKKEKYKMLFLY